MLQTLISPIASIAGTFIKGKVAGMQANAEAKVETAKAKATVAKKVAAGEMEWNNTMAEHSGNSLKDEWLTALISIPLVLAFTGHEDVVMRGFEALERMPDFYKTAVGVVFAASFGVQKLTQMFKR